MSNDNMTKAVKALDELTRKGWDYMDALAYLVKEYQVDEMELEAAWFKSYEDA